MSDAEQAGASLQSLDEPADDARVFAGDERLARWLTINGACQDEDRHHRWYAEERGGMVRVKNLRHGAVAANHAEYVQVPSGEVLAVAPYISRQALLLALVAWWHAAVPAEQDAMLASLEAIQPQHADVAPKRVFVDVAWAGEDDGDEDELTEQLWWELGLEGKPKDGVPERPHHVGTPLAAVQPVEEPDGADSASLPLRVAVAEAQDCMARQGFSACECAPCPGICRMRQRNTHQTRHDCPVMAAMILLAAMPHPWRYVTYRHGTYAVQLPTEYQQAVGALRWTEDQLPGGLLFEMIEARDARLRERGRQAA
jgi:hypothetical protein